MKKLNLIAIIAAIVSLGAYTPALALGVGVSANSYLTSNSNSNRGDDDNVSATGSEKIESEVETENSDDNSTSSERNRGKEGAEMRASSTGSVTSDEHKSTVSLFVQNLLRVADREPGIGAEVRIIAKEQNDSSSTTVEAINEVEGRGGIKTFFFGTDYKNVGTLRATLTQNAKHIVRLQALSSQTTDPTDKVELDAQIKILQDNQVKLEQFITLHESNFSLFGWLVRLFQ